MTLEWYCLHYKQLKAIEWRLSSPARELKQFTCVMSKLQAPIFYVNGEGITWTKNTGGYPIVPSWYFKKKLLTRYSHFVIDSLAPDPIIYIVFHSKFIICVGFQILHHCFCSWAKLENPFLIFILFSVANCIKSSPLKKIYIKNNNEQNKPFWISGY